MLQPLRIEVKSALVQEISGTSKLGKPYHMRKQAAWAYTYDAMGALNPFPERIEFSLNDNQDPFPVGNYTLCPADITFTIGGSLTAIAGTYHLAFTPVCDVMSTMRPIFLALAAISAAFIFAAGLTL